VEQFNENSVRHPRLFPQRQCHVTVPWLVDLPGTASSSAATNAGICIISFCSCSFVFHYCGGATLGIDFRLFYCKAVWAARSWVRIHRDLEYIKFAAYSVENKHYAHVPGTSRGSCQPTGKFKVTMPASRINGRSKELWTQWESANAGHYSSNLADAIGRLEFLPENSGQNKFSFRILRVEIIEKKSIETFWFNDQRGFDSAFKANFLPTGPITIHKYSDSE
jgi:hypothetical protein